MMDIPDAPWITGAERYGTAYTAAWRWGGDPEDYDRPDDDDYISGDDDDGYSELLDDEDELEIDL